MVSKKKNKKFFSRYTVFSIAAIVIFSSLIARLYFMQIVRGNYYKDEAINSSLKEISEPGARGDIVDRNGVVLATYKQSYALTFISTQQSDLAFFDTMEKVFKILDNKKEIHSDSFPLKISPFSFDFNTLDTKAQKTFELRFKKDRGFDSDIINEKAKTDKSYRKKTFNKLSLSDQKQVDEELLKITPEETFNLLWDKYTKGYLNEKSSTFSPSLRDKLNNYSLEEKRRFMLVKDALKIQSFSGYKPVIIAQNISRDTAFIFKEKHSELPGVDTSQQPIRTYPYGDLASAVIGNISRINPNNEKKYLELGYDINTDLVGVSGIEGTFESELKGKKGSTKVQVNKPGRIVKKGARVEPSIGNKVQLSINRDVQAIAEKALDKAMLDRQQHPNSSDANTANATRGAVVVLNVNTGEIIAMVSKPSFDPNIFSVTGGLTPDLSKQYFAPDLEAFGNDYIDKMDLVSKNPGKTKQEILDSLFPIDKSIISDTPIRKDERDIYPKPFLNYALNAVPPGSTFKPVTAMAALETGIITPEFSLYDNGSFDDGNNYIRHFTSDGENGQVDLTKAIAVSSNPYFMTLGKKLREANLSNPKDDILAQFAWKLGLGAPPTVKNPTTGIEIKNESFGQVYNSYTIKNNYANQYWITIANTLKMGKGYPVLYLAADKNDNASVKKIKTEIKTTVQNLIKEGGNEDTSLRTLLKNLVSSDEKYKGENFQNKDYTAIIQDINNIAVSNAHAQIMVGSNMYDASIGQSISAFTPLQMADYIATLVNGGNRYKVHLVNKIIDIDGGVLQEEKPQILSTTGFKPENVDAVKRGMKGVTGEKGTAREDFQKFSQFMETGGKTGSATYNDDQAAMGRTAYGWFVGFAPYDNPEIAVAAVIFDGGYGKFTAPVVRDVYEAYFKDSLKKGGFVPEDDFVQEFYNK